MKLLPTSKGRTAQVSDEDFPVVALMRWNHKLYLNRAARVLKSGSGAQPSLARFIADRMKLPKGQVQHKDGDPTNNQRDNLFVGRLSVCGRPVSKVVGVYWDHKELVWQGYVWTTRMGKSLRSLLYEGDSQAICEQTIREYRRIQAEAKKRRSVGRKVCKVNGLWQAWLNDKLLGEFETLKEANWKYNCSAGCLYG